MGEKYQRKRDSRSMDHGKGEVLALPLRTGRRTDHFLTIGMKRIIKKRIITRNFAGLKWFSVSKFRKFEFRRFDFLDFKHFPDRGPTNAAKAASAAAQKAPRFDAPNTPTHSFNSPSIPEIVIVTI